MEPWNWIVLQLFYPICFLQTTINWGVNPSVFRRIQGLQGHHCRQWTAQRVRAKINCQVGSPAKFRKFWQSIWRSHRNHMWILWKIHRHTIINLWESYGIRVCLSRNNWWESWVVTMECRMDNMAVGCCGSKPIICIPCCFNLGFEHVYSSYFDNTGVFEL
jgi:hypothetical protein